VIRQFTSAKGESSRTRVPTAPGTNQFVWDMTYPNARQLPRGDFAGVEWANAKAPVAVPGSYKVRLTAGGQSYEQSFAIREDPQVTASQQDLQAQFDLMMKIDAEIDQVTDTVHQIDKAREQLAALAKQGRPEVATAAAKLAAALYGVESGLVRMIDPAHPMFIHPKTSNLRLAELTTVVESSDAVPTAQSYQVLDVLSSEVTAAQKLLKPMLEEQLPALLKTAGSSSAPQ
jgi:hypothetical protein